MLLLLILNKSPSIIVNVLKELYILMPLSVLFNSPQKQKNMFLIGLKTFQNHYFTTILYWQDK